MRPAVQRGQGLKLIFVHGKGVDHRSLLLLDPVFDQFGGFERIYLDLPGFGQNPALEGKGGLPQYAHWLEQRLGELVGKQNFALVGHSMGALLVQEMAERFAPQLLGAALLAPVIYPKFSDRSVPPRRILWEDRQLMTGLSPAQRSAYEEYSVIRNHDNWQRFSRYLGPGMRAANLRAMVRLSKDYDLNPLPVNRSERHRFPVLALCGLQDHMVGYRDAKALARRYENFRCEVLGDAGHNLHIDQPRLVGELLGPWAAELMGAVSRRGEVEQ